MCCILGSGIDHNIYGSECWAVKAYQVYQLEVFSVGVYGTFLVYLGIGHGFLIMNCLGELEINGDLTCVPRERHMRWFGHVCRIDEG